MNRKGFSLLELLTVTAIVLILAATLMVGGIYGRGLSMTKSTGNVLRMLSGAAHAYASENNGEPPPSWVTADGWPATRWPPQPMHNPQKCGIHALCSYVFRGTDNRDAYADIRDFPSRFVRRDGSNVDHVRDAWEMPFFYYTPGAPSRNRDSFDIFSAGPDLKTTLVVQGFSYAQQGVVAAVRIKHTGDQPSLGRLRKVLEKTHGDIFDHYEWTIVKNFSREAYPGSATWDSVQNKWIYATEVCVYPSGHEEDEEYPDPNEYTYPSGEYIYPAEPDYNDKDRDWKTGHYVFDRDQHNKGILKCDWISGLTPADNGKVYVAEMITASPDVIMNDFDEPLESPVCLYRASKETVYSSFGDFERMRITDSEFTYDDIGNF